MPGKQLKIFLEKNFGIPFVIEQYERNGNLEMIVTPAGVYRDEAFSIKISFHNHLRIIVEFVPGKFCANMIHSMGCANEEKKKQAVAYSSAMLHRNGQIKMHINGNEVNPQDYNTWPNNWNQLQLRITRAPILAEHHDQFDYNDLAIFWGGSVLGMILSLLDIVPVEESAVLGAKEGDVHIILSKRYERNKINRTACLLAKGTSCSICGMDFKSTYGEIGSGFIHVHHIIPVSRMGNGYILDPVKDLSPVCPNCHAMLHKTDPPLEIEQLKEMFNANCL